MKSGKVFAAGLLGTSIIAAVLAGAGKRSGRRRPPLPISRQAKSRRSRAVLRPPMGGPNASHGVRNTISVQPAAMAKRISSSRISLPRTLAAGFGSTTGILLIIYKLPRVWAIEQVDLARIAGSMTGVENLSAARGLGLLGQFFNGTLFVHTYRLALVAADKESTMRRGMIFGASLWLLGPMLVMPVLLTVHPEVRAGKMPNPGIFMRRWKHGRAQATVFLAGHHAFGAIAGGILTPHFNR